MTARVVIVGEAPGKRGRPSRPLPASRIGSAGYRLCVMAAVDPIWWESHVVRMNVVPYYPGPKYPSALARSNAECLCHSVLRGCTLVLLGRKTARAFGLKPADYEWCQRVTSPLGPKCIVIPHPSGLCREYNDPKVRRRVGRLVGRLLGGP